jgi:hypothetical protein
MALPLKRFLFRKTREVRLGSLDVEETARVFHQKSVVWQVGAFCDATDQTPCIVLGTQ